MFPIGVFPFVMIAATLIFFNEFFHQRIIQFLSFNRTNIFKTSLSLDYSKRIKMLTTIFLSTYILIQLLFPMRFLLYPGELFWTEQGYRFSWRVMLIEKVGSADFLFMTIKTDLFKLKIVTL